MGAQALPSHAGSPPDHGGGQIYEGAPRVSILVERPQEPRSSRERGAGQKREDRGRRAGRETRQTSKQAQTRQSNQPNKDGREERPGGLGEPEGGERAGGSKPVIEGWCLRFRPVASNLVA